MPDLWLLAVDTCWLMSWSDDDSQGPTYYPDGMTVLSFDGMDTTRTSMNVVLFLHYVCQYRSI